MALEAADDDLDVEIFDELDSYSKIFEELSLQLLEFSYQSDDDLTQHLLTASLDNWSRQTCLSLAVVANNLRLDFFLTFGYTNPWNFRAFLQKTDTHVGSRPL